MSRESHESHKGRKSLTALVCGGMAGLIAKTIVAPLDRIKIIFQVKDLCPLILDTDLTHS